MINALKFFCTWILPVQFGTRNLLMIKMVMLHTFSIQGRVWVVPSEYSDAEPDPLRNFAESVVEEMNSEHAEDVHRIYSIYAESDFQVVLNLFC